MALGSLEKAMAHPRQNSKARVFMEDNRRRKQKTQRRGYAKVDLLCTSHQLTTSCHISQGILNVLVKGTLASLRSSVVALLCRQRLVVDVTELGTLIAMGLIES